MDYITFMVVTDHHSPVKRFQVRRQHIFRAAIGLGIASLLVMVATWDYWRLRADNRELDTLRVQSVEQGEQLATVEQTLASVRDELDRVREFERKVRIIANLPGSAAVGGDEIGELAPAQQVGSGEGEMPVLPPAGVPVDLTNPEPVGEGAQYAPPVGGQNPQALSLAPGASSLRLEDSSGLTTKAALHIHKLDTYAQKLGMGIGIQADSLNLLLEELDAKRERLSSMPSIWPTKGWLTSRYGYRISPFTGKRQLHAGIDIASASGTPIIAPAHGKVIFAGTKGPLGKAIIIDHGQGVRTLYGHTKGLNVKKGESVVRGQEVAWVGSSGRSTGPHLHYVVEVDGKSRNPLNYIFD